MRTVFAIFLLLILGSPGTQAALAEYEFVADFVDVAPDTSGRMVIAGCDMPSADFQMSTYEATNTEYAAFLNAVARLGDPYGLYSPMQARHFWGGIVKTRTGTVNSYWVKQGYHDLPVTFVNWRDAARYVNWLHYGRPDTGTSGPGTTEGSATEGAYDTTRFSAGMLPARRNRGARYFIPSCGEWIFSGFYDPAAGALTRYVGGNTLPAAGRPDTHARSANYYVDRWALPFPHLATVTAYSRNRSALGTHNQAGNVMEWVETTVGNGKMALGGSLFMPADTLSSSYRDTEKPGVKLSTFGFRVARIPEAARAPRLKFVAPAASAVPAPVTRTPAYVPPAHEWVRVGHPGNISDLETGRGCVPHEYEIASAEITNAQYATFLNAVARRHDRYRLFVQDMATGVVGGINRRRKDNDYVYAAKPGYEHRPVTYLSWFSLARYANWRHYGMPQGQQEIGVTEGSPTRGAYDTSGFEVFQQDRGPAVVDATLFARNRGARYFIPSDDEWVKAAYYDPARRGWQKYWRYPGRADVPPANRGESARKANFQADTLGEGPPYYVSEVGRFGAGGYYDVRDLGGNVWEWVETWRGLGDGDCWRCDVATKGLRGGSFNYTETGLAKWNIDPGKPGDRYFVYGGRLARRVESGASGTCLPASLRQTLASIVYRVSLRLRELQ